MRSVALSEFNKTLPTVGDYAVGNIFFPKDPSIIAHSKSKIETLVNLHGLELIGWRPVPVDNSMLGRDPLESEPLTEQVFIGNRANRYNQREFEQVLMKVRKVVEDECMEERYDGFYINSLTGKSITYKGQLTPEQVSVY
mgnify:CR=1 FL=1